MAEASNLNSSASKMVINALTELNPKEGLSFDELITYAGSRFGADEQKYRNPLMHALKRGLKYKILNYKGGNYVLNKNFLDLVDLGCTRTKKPKPKKRSASRCSMTAQKKRKICKGQRKKGRNGRRNGACGGCKSSGQKKKKSDKMKERKRRAKAACNGKGKASAKAKSCSRSVKAKIKNRRCK